MCITTRPAQVILLLLLHSTVTNTAVNTFFVCYRNYHYHYYC
jgi:hypothetical protein